MQVNLNKRTIDHHLSAALEKGGGNGPVFKWYLAMQIHDITHHLENDIESEDFLPYPRIKLPTAPKSNFYPQEKDYEEYHSSPHGLSTCKNPTLNIHLMNCIKPQCLHWSQYEQIIATEIIENSPLHTQQFHRQNPLVNGDVNADFDIVQVNKNEGVNTASNMPTNMFVDNTLDNTAKAVKMTF